MELVDNSKYGAEVAGRYAAVMGLVEAVVVQEIKVNTMEELSELISGFVTRVCRGINGVFVYKFSENPTEGVILIRNGRYEENPEYRYISVAGPNFFSAVERSASTDGSEVEFDQSSYREFRIGSVHKSNTAYIRCLKEGSKPSIEVFNLFQRLVCPLFFASPGLA